MKLGPFSFRDALLSKNDLPFMLTHGRLLFVREVLCLRWAMNNNHGPGYHDETTVTASSTSALVVVVRLSLRWMTELNPQGSPNMIPANKLDHCVHREKIVIISIVLK